MLKVTYSHISKSCFFFSSIPLFSAVSSFHQVVFDASLQRCLDSYLHHAPRGLDLAALPSSPAVAEMQRSVHRAVFLTFLRMATHKESKVENLWSLKRNNSLMFCSVQYLYNVYNIYNTMCNPCNLCLCCSTLRRTLSPQLCLEKLSMKTSCLTFQKFWIYVCCSGRATVSYCIR